MKFVLNQAGNGVLYHPGDSQPRAASTVDVPSRRRFVRSSGAIALMLAAEAVRAHGDRPHGSSGPAKKEQMDWGIAGEPKAVGRTIVVRMSDDMRFSPSLIDVRQGETVRFSIRNDGRLMHEFVIGTQAENAKHAEQMLKFPNMEHDEPYMAHVQPGKTAQLIWTFNRAGDFEFACLIAGHYQSGMVGRIRVRPRAPGRSP